MGNAAIAFYLACRKLNAKRSDFIVDDIRRYAMQSLKLTSAQRRDVLVDLARFMAGEVACPKCGEVGPHTSNQHHRVGSIKFTCRGCGITFKPTEQST